MTNKLIGREKEQAILKKMLETGESEMVAVIGRRRVGKTFLIRGVFAENIRFEVTGLQNATLPRQLSNFAFQLRETFGVHAPVNAPTNWLDEWRTQLGNGLSTWAESPEPCRSDCHAWGAHPNIEIFRTVLGVDSGAPGFQSVRIQPHPGRLRRISGVVPHPRGMIRVAGEIVSGQWHFTVSLPEGVLGVFVWEGKTTGLKAGVTKLAF